MVDKLVVIILDLDGTLINLGDSVDFDELLVRAFTEIRVQAPPQSERDRLWRAGPDHEQLLKSWGVANARQFWDVFDKLDFDARSTAVREGRITLFDDSILALSRLKGSGRAALAVHTNTPARLATFQLEYFGLAGFFDMVLALDKDGYDQSRAKPEPWGIHFIQDEITRRALAEKRRIHDTTTIKKNTVLIGDSELDMIAARSAGVPGILVWRRAGEVPSNTCAFKFVNTLAKIDMDFIDKTILGYRAVRF